MAKNHQDHNGDDNAVCPSEDEIFSLSEIKKLEADNEKKWEKFCVQRVHAGRAWPMAKVGNSWQWIKTADELVLVRGVPWNTLASIYNIIFDQSS